MPAQSPAARAAVDEEGGRRAASGWCASASASTRHLYRRSLLHPPLRLSVPHGQSESRSAAHGSRRARGQLVASAAACVARSPMRRCCVPRSTAPSFIYNPSRWDRMLGPRSRRRNRCSAAARRPQAAALRAVSRGRSSSAIAALGGQGGGVLADWLIEIAEADGYLAQSTSVPGVAQRTGRHYLLPGVLPAAGRRSEPAASPIMALMPVAGDVDCVVAAELVEAGRAIARGLVTPERTTLIASSHREYTISEKSAMGQGAADTEASSSSWRAVRRSGSFYLTWPPSRSSTTASSAPCCSAQSAAAGCCPSAAPHSKPLSAKAASPSIPILRRSTMRASVPAWRRPMRKARRRRTGCMPPESRTGALGTLCSALDRVRQLPQFCGAAAGARGRAPRDRLSGSGIRRLVSEPLGAHQRARERSRRATR